MREYVNVKKPNPSNPMQLVDSSVKSITIPCVSSAAADSVRKDLCSQLARNLLFNPFFKIFFIFSAWKWIMIAYYRHEQRFRLEFVLNSLGVDLPTDFRASHQFHTVENKHKCGQKRIRRLGRCMKYHHDVEQPSVNHPKWPPRKLYHRMHHWSYPAQMWFHLTARYSATHDNMKSYIKLGNHKILERCITFSAIFPASFPSLAEEPMRARSICS